MASEEDQSGSHKPGRDERQRLVIEYVLNNGFAVLGELVGLTSVSTMTVHRDLDDLASRGFVRRVRGGVSALPTSMFESSSEFRMQRNTESKRRLAKKGLEFVEAGMSIMLDDSTTVHELAKLLPEIGHLTVISNYRQTLEALREADDIAFIMLGGQYSRPHDSFIGPPSETGLNAYATDIVLQSTSTIDDEYAYHQEQDLVMMKRGMLESGSRRVLILDGSKVGRSSLYRFAHLSEFTDVIVTPDVPRKTVDNIAEHASVHIVPEHP